MPALIKLNIVVVNWWMIRKDHGKNNTKTMPTATTLGTNARAGSFICVTVCSTLEINPTTTMAIVGGAHKRPVVCIANMVISMINSSVIAKLSLETRDKCFY